MANTKTTTLSATFPVVKEFRDYHDIDAYADDVNDLFDKKIRCEEICFSCGYYWGVFYVGRKPAKAVIDQLLADAGFEPDEDDE
jgi:hypothetical protein